MTSPDRDILPDSYVPINRRSQILLMLSYSVKPTNYAISIHDVELGGAFSYQGTVKIDVDIKTSTDEIVLNSHELKIKTARVHVAQSKCPSLHSHTLYSVADSRPVEQAIETSDISYDEKSQRATLSFPQELPQSSKAVLTITFAGIMNNVMAGFYRSKYKPAAPPVPSVARDDEFHYMFSTQFESCDARRAFPCFDEPNLKATFDFEIEIPDDQVALSNMTEKEVVRKDKGLKVVSFERTPVMSTYVSIARSYVRLRPY